MTGASARPATRATPARRAGSIRRTTAHVTARPDGPDGAVTLAASGRDLLTSCDGRDEVLDEVRLEASIDFYEWRLLGLRLTPPGPRLDRLIGTSAYAGFRNAVRACCPEEAGSHSLRYQLLDDLPVAAMASGRSLRAEGLPVSRRTDRAPPVDLCAGFARDSVAVAAFGAQGAPLTIGPEAPDLADPDDPAGWHVQPAPAPHQTRRVRRIDVWHQGRRAEVDAFFRDSHVDGRGRHTVVHEWSTAAEIDPGTFAFGPVVARPGPLPYPECPGAAASAARLAGRPVDDARREVSDGFRGPLTCSHLNDSLRALEDAGALLRRLADRIGGG